MEDAVELDAGVAAAGPGVLRIAAVEVRDLDELRGEIHCHS